MSFKNVDRIYESFFVVMSFLLTKYTFLFVLLWAYLGYNTTSNSSISNVIVRKCTRESDNINFKVNLVNLFRQKNNNNQPSEGPFECISIQYIN